MNKQIKVSSPAPRSIRFLRKALTALIGLTLFAIAIMTLVVIFDGREPEINLATGMIHDPETLERLGLPENVKATAVLIEAPVTNLRDQIAVYATLFMGAGLFLYLLVLTRRFIIRIEEADAASFWDVSLLRRIGWVLIAYNIFTFLQGLLDYFVIENSVAGAASDYPDQLLVSVVPAVAGLIAFAFAEILRRGAQLHKDVEGTI